MSGMKDVCGLFIRTSKTSGKKFMTGLNLSVLQGLDAEKTDLLIFKNDKKKAANEPDYKVVAVEKREKPQSNYRPPPPPREEPEFGF